MESETDLIQNENLLENGRNIKIIPDLEVFSQKEKEEILRKAVAEIEILRQQIGLIQNKFYKNIWNKFLNSFGLWLRKNDEPVFLEYFLLLSNKFNTLIAGFWLLEGFLSLKSEKYLGEISKQQILEILKSISLKHSQNLHSLKRREYNLIVSLFSKYFELFSQSTWRDWILGELSGISSSQKLSFQQRLVFDIVLYYTENVHSDQTLTNELILGVVNGLTSIFASNIDSYFKLSLKSMLKILSNCNQELSSLVNSLLRQLKRNTSKPLNQLILLEIFTQKNIISYLQKEEVLKELISILSEIISSSIGSMISNNGKTDQNLEDIQIIQNSLNLCFQLIPSHFNLHEWLEETILAISSSKTNDQSKVSLLLIIGSIHESLARYRIEGIPVNYNLTNKAQDLLLSLIYIKLPMVSSQSSDHFKSLAVHICSLSYVLLNGSKNHPFSDKFLEKIQSLIDDPSINETCKLLVISSFTHSILLLKKLGITNDNDLFDKSRVKQIIISNNNVSGIFGSALNKNVNLKKLSMTVLGQIISIQDVFDETNIFKSLDIVTSIRTSPLLFPKLGTLLDGSYCFYPNNYKNAEVNILLVLREIVFNENSRVNFNIDFQKNIEEESMDLKSYLLTLSDPSKIQSANYLISLLIQMGRVLSFLPDKGDLSCSVSQYSAVNIEAFQSSLMLPGLKKPIVNRLCDEDNSRIKQKWFPFTNYTGIGSLLNEKSFCQNLILSFATILSSLNSLINKRREQGILESEIKNELMLARMDLFKVWVCLGNLEIISKGDPSNIGYSHYLIFLLCSYHPLLYSGPNTMNSEYKSSLSSKNELVHEALIKDLVNNWSNIEEIKETMNKKFIELYRDLIYLPLNDVSGFRNAGVNLLNIITLTRDSKLTLSLIENLKIKFMNSLEFLNDLPVEFGNFVISDPNQVFEFNVNIAAPQNFDQGFIQDLQSKISTKLKSFTSSEQKYDEFSEFYSSLTNSSSWLNNILLNLDNISSINNSNKETSEQLTLKNKDLESESNTKNSSSDTASSKTKPNTSASTNVTATSAFALAKLRKSQADNKSKAAKITKNPASHANITNARSHANSNTGNNLSTCNGSLGANNSTGGNNLTKEEILRQKLTEQNNLRKDVDKIISTIKNEVDVMVGVFLSCISELEDDKDIYVMDLEFSEILYSVCSKMLEFKPLRQYGLSVLEKLFERIKLENNRLGRSMVEYLSKQDDESRNICLQEILDSINFKRPNSVHIYLKNSSGVSVLVYIISRVLYNNCKERGANSDKQIQIITQLIQYLSGSMRHGGLKVSMVQLLNMLYLYVLALGDLVDLDQYLHPLKALLSELRPINMGEVDLVSSLLVFANPQVRLLTLDSLKRALDISKMEISYFTFMNLSIAREIQIFASNSNNDSFSDDLSLISSISEELIEVYYNLIRSKSELNFDDQNKKLVNDLIEIQIVPVISTLQQRNISKTILRVTNEKHCSDIVKGVISSSERVFNGFEKRRTFSKEDWPNNLKVSLISSMVPNTIRHFDSIIPEFTENGLEKIVSRIQARHALKGLVLILSDIVIKLCESDFSFIEDSIHFILTKIVDSNLFEDYISEGERLSLQEANENIRSKEKKTVKNLVGSFGNKQDSPEKIKIQGYDISSKEELKKVIVDFFVSLSSRHDIQKFSSSILIILRDLSSQYKPRINPKDFHNFLAFAIGSIASCCSPSDPVVYKVTCKIINELLSGSLVRNNNQNNNSSDSNSKIQFPMLTDIPQEYSRILPRLFEMLYNKQEDKQGLKITRFEDLDKNKYLEYKIDSEDISVREEKLSVYELYSISLCKALYSENPGERIGAAHIFGSLSKGISVRRLRDFGILEAIENTLKCQDGQKSGETNNLEGLLLCIGSISLYLEYIIEPYTVQFLKSIMHLFSGSDQRIRFYSEKSAEIIIKNLSRYGARLILPIITEGIEEKQWRIKLTSLQLLGIMALNSPHQLSSYLPKAIQTIYQTTSDSHPKVSDAARETLFKMSSLIKNPEVNYISQDLITSLIDPTELNFKKALLSLKSVTFVHAIDITTLSLIFPVLLKTIQERGGTDLKKDAIQILTSLLLLLSDKTDVDPFLSLIENSIHNTLTDPIPEIRLLTAKLCRALVTVTGQEKASSLLSWLFKTLSMEVGQTLKSGVSASLAEVLSAFGIEKFTKILPFIVSQIQKSGDDSSSQSCQNQCQFENQEESLESNSIVESTSTSVAAATSTREGYIGLFVYLPQSFGEDLGPLMPNILPVLLSRLGDESDSVREVAFKACKALVVQFGSDHAAYILQPLEEGLGNDSWRVRLSSCSLLGTLLNRLIKGQLDSTGRALNTNTSAIGDAGFSMHRRSYILAAIYMARSDENTSVKNSATALWKSLVQNTPQTLKDILTILIRRIINALSTSSSGNIHYIAVQSLKDLLDKFGSALYNKLLPIFYQNLGGSLNEDGNINLDSSSNSYKKGEVCNVGENALPKRSVRIGSCIGVLEILKTVRKSELKGLTSSFLPIVKIGLCDEDITVRTYSVECLDIFASENTEILFSIINWLMDEILAPNNNNIEHYNEDEEDPKISAIELIIQLSHSGIVSNILPRVISDPMTINKIRIIKSMSKIPSQNRLRSSLFDIIPKLIETSIDIDGKFNDFIQNSSKEAMMTIVQSLEAQSMETFATILLDIIRENTPNTNLSISGRYQIENLKINDLSELIVERETLIRIKAIEFLTLSLFASSTIYETSISILIKYLIPLSLCDISEQVRISASKAFYLFSISVPRKSIIQVCNVMKESIGTLVHDPIDNKRHFNENKFIGSNWKIFNNKVIQSIINKEEVSERSGNDELLISSNKLIDSISAVYIQGISQGSADSKEECAIGLREVIQLTNNECLKPITVKLVGPLIRSISDRTTSSLVRGALLSNLVLFLESCGLQLRPLLPQIQTILVKFLLDPNENVRKQCSYGIGFLSRLLGNRAEVLLSDLCSLASKQNQSEESMNALLSSINLSLNSNIGGKLTENQTKPVISELLRNKLIGMALSCMEESKDFAIKDISGQILSSILISYCKDEEIKDILLPLLIIKDQNGCKLNQDKNIINIFNSCCESNGWSKMYSSLGNLDKDIISNLDDDDEQDEEKEEEENNESIRGISLSSKNVDKYLSMKNRELIIGGRRLPEEILESQSWWIYKKIVIILYKYLVCVEDNNNNNNNNTQNSSSYSQLRKLSLNFLYNLTRIAVENNDSFSASIVLQVLPLVFEKDLLVLFPSFSDTHMILEIQKICEKIMESKDSRILFQKQIDSNLSSYSFGSFIKLSDINSRIQGNEHISSQDILFSLISLPSIQSLNSKFPAIKLKAEQFLVSLIKLMIKLRESQDQHIINNNSRMNNEEVSQFESVISEIINVIEKIYPGHLNQQKANFIKEYTRRVLSKAIN